ncbi:MAG: N-6 DNA methylase, partial [Nanoarchaeota archaeon]|nr:N-6 DNA methylase [Nanoarchaeota archaeon]
MVDKEIAKEKVKKLVEKFESYSKGELDSMKEEQIKFRFIEPLLELLGWEREEIFKEERVLKGRADYILKLGNQDKLVVETKATNVHLEEKEGRQAVSYAYHRKIKFSVLTNFKYLRVYHALSNIKRIDNNLLKKEGANFIIEAKDFVEKFNLLWLLSKESFEKDEINKLLSAKDERINKPIDESILADLLEFRKLLSKDLKSKRMQLENSHIDEIVQILIDRLIFMRSVEDRGLEAQDFLLKIIKDVEKGLTDMNLWAVLKSQFKRFDLTYNSKLFAEGVLEKEGFFDNNVLAKVIRGLYYGTQHQQERYMFDEIPVDLLGSIYEQYLGVVLRGTEKRVRLDLESGKRKKMGIYYTPSYIVDYIVKNTVGEYCKEKSLDEVLNVKVVDPACGSGSFLICAFQELINIVEERLKNGEKSKKYTHAFQEWKEKLSLGEKATILINCIYGVDLDEKAVELAQLNLLLKILEEETRETRKKILPNMKDNIKNGNSLISDSSYDKAFNWNAQFSDVFRDGGFDVVVGNPPYVRSQLLKPDDKKYFSKNYVSASNQYDIYILFIEKAIKILKEKGLLGFINPNKFLISDYGLKLREFIIENTHFKNILDVSNLEVFKGVGIYPVIFILQKSLDREEIKILRDVRNSIILSGPAVCYEKLNPSSFEENSKKIISLEIKGNVEELCNKIKEDSLELGKLAEVYRGVIPPIQKEYVIKEEIINSKKALRGRDIKRYFHKWNGEFLRYDKILNINKSKKFEGEKIIMPRTVLSLKASLDEQNLNLIDRVYYIKLNENKISLKVLLGIINSKLIDFYYKTYFGASHLQGNYLDLKGVDLKKIPIKIPSSSQAKKIK